ncbi:8195_t:CDS:2, partial [Entrophospora sp. SA101]
QYFTKNSDIPYLREEEDGVVSVRSQTALTSISKNLTLQCPSVNNNKPALRKRSTDDTKSGPKNHHQQNFRC